MTEQRGAVRIVSKKIDENMLRTRKKMELYIFKNKKHTSAVRSTKNILRSIWMRKSDSKKPEADTEKGDRVRALIRRRFPC